MFDTRYDQRVAGFILCEDVPKITFLQPQASSLGFFFANTKNFRDNYILTYFGGSHLCARAAMAKWFKAPGLKPKTWVQLSTWPSLLSNQHYIESSIY